MPEGCWFYCEVAIGAGDEKLAPAAQLSKRTTCHTLRPSFATHLFEDSHDIPTARAQELLGHRDESTTTIYPHVLNRGPAAVRGPADRLLPDVAAHPEANRRSAYPRTGRGS